MSMNLEGLTLIDGVELSDGTLMIIENEADLVAKNQTHSAVMYKKTDAAWEPGGIFARGTTAVCIDYTGERLYSVNESGIIASVKPGDGKRHYIRSVDDATYNGQAIRALRNIHGTVYAAGMGYYVYQQVDNESWKEIGNPDRLQSDLQIRGFEDMAKLGETLYFVGWGGAIWSYTNEEWTRHKSPTNIMLGCAATNEAENCVFAAGKMGTILQYKDGVWTKLEHNLTDMQIYDIETYNGITYFSGYFGILKYENGELSYEKLIDESLLTTMMLFSGPSGIWSVGSSTLALFDGERWKVVLETSKKC